MQVGLQKLAQAPTILAIPTAMLFVSSFKLIKCNSTNTHATCIHNYGKDQPKPHHDSYVYVGLTANTHPFANSVNQGCVHPRCCPAKMNLWGI